MGWKSPVLILTLWSSVSYAGPFGESNLVLVQVGDGTAISRVAAPAFLKEVTKTGLDVQTIALPTAVSGQNRRLTLDGVGTSEGFLRRSTNLENLTLCGYDAALGTQAVAFTPSQDVNRVVAVITSSGAVETTTALADAYSGGAIRAAMLHGSGLWISGSSGSSEPLTGGLRYAMRNGGTTVQLVASPTTVRVPVIFGGQLFMSASDAAFQGVASVGSGLPTSGQFNPVGLQGLVGSHTVPADFTFADAQTLYVADDRNLTSGGGIQKWTFNGTQWIHAYTLSNGLSVSIRRIALEDVGGTRTLYGLTSEAKANSLVKVTDTGPSSQFTVLRTAAFETAYRGVSLTPKRAGTPIAVTHYVLVRGAEFQGQLSSLWQVDNDLLDVFSDDSSLDAEIEVVGASPATSGSQLRLECEYWVERFGLSTSIQFFNVVTRRFQSIGGAVSATNRTLIAVSTNSPGLFIDEGGAVRARVRWAPINDEDPAQDGWLHRIDRLEWALVP
ncbi:MAG TPA: hypothetical protein PKA27_01860 [Fimbriimonadaceae bacterium]|nr:hypothetical protein [Fimbriimonadaceae bacterium]